MSPSSSDAAHPFLPKGKRIWAQLHSLVKARGILSRRSWLALFWEWRLSNPATAWSALHSPQAGLRCLRPHSAASPTLAAANDNPTKAGFNFPLQCKQPKSLVLTSLQSHGHTFPTRKTQLELTGCTKGTASCCHLHLSGLRGFWKDSADCASLQAGYQRVFDFQLCPKIYLHTQTILDRLEFFCWYFHFYYLCYRSVINGLIYTFPMCKMRDTV